jgi:hypothetical protein
MSPQREASYSGSGQENFLERAKASLVDGLLVWDRTAAKQHVYGPFTSMQMYPDRPTSVAIWRELVPMLLDKMSRLTEDKEILPLISDTLVFHNMDMSYGDQERNMHDLGYMCRSCGSC